MTDAEKWQRDAQKLERSSFLVTFILIACLYPLWTFFDLFTAPQFLAEFASVRFSIAGLSLIAFAIVRRTQSAVIPRIAMGTLVTLLGVSVAWLVAQVPASVVVTYTIGFSIVFWATALLLVWPWRMTVVVYSLCLIAHVGLWVANGMPDPRSFFGLFWYLLSASFIATLVGALRRRSEHQKHLAKYETEKTNAELATALATLKDAQERFVATEKLQALGRLIAQLSHEINNPMNVIENNVGPVSEYLAALGKALDIARAGGDLEAAWDELEIDFVRTDMQDAIDAMATSAGRVRAIHNDLRAFMRGDTALPTEADLNDGVRSTIAMLKRSVGSETELVERYGELPKARFHIGQVNQVTLNLIQNALDVVGGAGRIEVETAHEDDKLVLSVTDSGPGVSEAARRHLFEPFFTTKDVGKGTGLGLATCYQIVRAHGGSISLDESHTRGARFVVRLPLAPPA